MERAQQQELIRAQMAQRAQPQPQRQMTVEERIEQAIDGAPLPDRAKHWLRQHPEYFVDARLNARLQHYHFEASQQHEPFSDAYYDKMES